MECFWLINQIAKVTKKVRSYMTLAKRCSGNPSTWKCKIVLSFHCIPPIWPCARSYLLLHHVWMREEVWAELRNFVKIVEKKNAKNYIKMISIHFWWLRTAQNINVKILQGHHFSEFCWKLVSVVEGFLLVGRWRGPSSHGVRSYCGKNPITIVNIYSLTLALGAPSL